ncbi:MAG: NAD(P)/FAD-dependent oxidoreductase [Polyangiaceae bacterium]|nr:NAD(P)/FAD-dependent oxidoreductase [Polyangiaceae bacterium]
MTRRTSKDYFYTPETPRTGGPPYLTEASPASARYQRPERLLANPDAIVIGSGIGGMGIASILAQKKGWKVLLLEACKTPGGSTRCRELDGFEFPLGIDSIGDMDPTVGRGLYRPSVDFLTGGRLEWAKMPDLHEICTFGEDKYEWFSSPEKNIEWVERRFPGEGDVRGYYDLEHRVEWWAWAWAVTKLFPLWVPEGMREVFYQAFGGAWREYMGRRVTEVFTDTLGYSPKLASVFSYMYGNHGRTPKHAPFAFHAVNLFHYRYGAYYPVGGPGQIAECIIPIVEQAGGQLAVDCRVKRILVEQDTAVGVEIETGETIRAPLVISDASAYTTWMDLVDPAVSERLGYAEKFRDIRPSPGHVYLFLGYDEAIDLPKQIFWHMPTYPGIPQYDLDAADDHYKKDMALEGMGGYLLCPSARDPVHSQRYPNKSTVVVLAEAPYAWVEKSRQDLEFKQSLEARLADNLEQIAFFNVPQIQGKTPVVRRAGVSTGCNPFAWEACSLGLEPSGDRFVKHTHWLTPKTKIKNLYLTGQDAFSAGFAGSMLSSRICYSALTNNWFHLLQKSP